MSVTSSGGRGDDRVLERIGRLIEDGASLDEVERRVIRPARRDEDGRSALWLYAWHQANDRTSRRPAPRATAGV
jgi:hypothetical protein